VSILVVLIAIIVVVILAIFYSSKSPNYIIKLNLILNIRFTKLFFLLFITVQFNYYYYN